MYEGHLDLVESDSPMTVSLSWDRPADEDAAEERFVFPTILTAKAIPAERINGDDSWFEILLQKLEKEERIVQDSQAAADSRPSGPNSRRGSDAVISRKGKPAA